MIKEIENEKNKADVPRIWSCLIQQFKCFEKTQIVNTFEVNELKITQLGKPKHCDIDEAVLKWFKQQRNDNVSISGPLLMIEVEEFERKLEDEAFMCNANRIVVS